MPESLKTEASKIADLDANIAAYEKVRDVMEKHHMRKYVVFYNEEWIDAFDTFDAAAREAIRRFGRGPYLIRKVGAGKVILPSSVRFQHMRKYVAG